MNYQITYPLNLLLLVLLPGFWAIAYFKREYIPKPQFYVLNILRSLVVLLLVLALSGLRIPLKTFRDLALVFVVDVSESISEYDRTWMRDFMIRTAGSLKSEDLAGLVTFGSSSNIELRPIIRNEAMKTLKKDGGFKKINGEFTNIFSGIQAGLSALPTDTIRRIVLLSDGNENIGNALKAAESAKDLDIKIYSILLPEKKRKEVLVHSFNVPDMVREGEAFRLKVTILNTSDTATKGTLRLFREKKQIKKIVIPLSPGLNSYEHSYSLADPGTYEFSTSIESEADTDDRNNEMTTSTTVHGRSRILVIDGDGDKNSFLSKALKLKNMMIVVKGVEGLPTVPAVLGNYDLLIFNNVPATEIKKSQMKMIQHYVRNFGGGFVMIGGDNSYGSGGYRDTMIEDILPVTSEENISYKFKQVLLYLVIDRSSSMEGQKMELAKRAAVRVVSQMKNHDMIGVILFDSVFHEKIPLTMIRGRRDEIISKINTIRASKGGTNIYPALDKAYQSLRKDQGKLKDMLIQVKHIILLTDGKSYTGDFEGLAKAISKARMSVSGIAIGPSREVSVDLLKQISRLGKGLFHHPSDIDNLPNVFSVDLDNAISKAPFVERAFTPKKKEEGKMMKGIDEFPPLKGYMVTSAKPGTQVLLESTTRGMSDPILSTWRCGIGKSTAYTSDVDARWSSRWIEWSQFSKFWSQVARYTMRTRIASKYKVSATRTLDGAILVAENRGKETPAGELVAGLVGPDGQTQEVVLKRVSPGKYQSRIKVGKFGKFLVNIREKKNDKTHSYSVQSLVISPHLSEYRKISPNKELLKKIAAITGGVFNPAIGKEIISYENEIQEPQDIWSYLTILALLIFMVDIAVRRLWL